MELAMDGKIRKQAFKNEIFSWLCKTLASRYALSLMLKIMYWIITALWYFPIKRLSYFQCARPADLPSQTFIRSDEGLALETSALKLFAVANLRYQVSW